MQSYLERYQQGDYAQVWKELTASGDAVRIEPLYSDARAVARETMRRARHNIEVLIERLQKIGFEFVYPEAVLSPLSPEQLAELDAFERKVGHVPLSLCAWLETVGSVNFMGSFPRLSYYESNDNPLFAFMTGGGKVETTDLESLMQQGFDDVPSEFSAGISILQNAFKKLTEQGFLGEEPAGRRKKAGREIAEADRVMSDPLVVDPSEISIDAYQEWQEYEEDQGAYFVTIAPDILHKSNISGGDGYEIYLPDAAADAPLHNTEWHDLTFVEYLRLSFQWAGFPGVQDYERRDEKLLALLREGLLPL